mmetsp:Transcript_7455/g.11131  ORF Transcript_7455/g.11131 Transcript_7455/m.11131 type:complete len:93 (+) Transcript_7455:2-280(+)
MKRVQQGEDVFAEFSSSSPNAEHDISNNVLHGFSVETKAVPSSAINTLKMYDGLSQNDQGAVHILYQMTQPGACVYYEPHHDISHAACYIES